MTSGAPRVLGYREFQVLGLVERDLEECGAVRTYSEIAAALGMKHRSVVCDVIRRLEHRGLIERLAAGRRCQIRLKQPESHGGYHE